MPVGRSDANQSVFGNGFTLHPRRHQFITDRQNSGISTNNNHSYLQTAKYP